MRNGTCAALDQVDRVMPIRIKVKMRFDDTFGISFGENLRDGAKILEVFSMAFIAARKLLFDDPDSKWRRERIPDLQRATVVGRQSFADEPLAQLHRRKRISDLLARYPPDPL